MRGTEGGAGLGGEAWAVGWGVEPSDLPFLLLQAPVSVWEEEEDGATFTVTSRQYQPLDSLVRL